MAALAAGAESSGMLAGLWMGQPVWMWLVFMTVVLVLLVLDLGVLHRGKAGAAGDAPAGRVIGFKESLYTTLGYMALSCLFGLWVGWQLGGEKALQYFTGYVVEFSLSMDNVFVIAMILGYFAVPPRYQHRVLFWGVLGVIILRGVMVALGAAVVAEYHWVLYVFAAFLVFTGVKMLLSKDEGEEGQGLENNRPLRLLKSTGRVSETMHGDRFFVRLQERTGGSVKTYMTPLFVALVMVEIADVVFAVDSVPAIFAITTDPYIVFTSNIFAILGLRSLFFALSAVIERFAYVKTSLAVLLMFIGSKIFLLDFAGIHVPPEVSLGLTFVILGSGIGYSLWRTRRPVA